MITTNVTCTWGRTIVAAVMMAALLGAPEAQSSDCTIAPGSDVPRMALDRHYYPTTQSGDASDCPALCDQWATACKHVVAAWNKCASQHYAAGLKMAEALCATSPNDAQRNACQSRVDADRETYGRIAGPGDTAEAKDRCETLVPECVSGCEPILCSSAEAPQCDGLCGPGYECVSPEQDSHCQCKPLHP